METMQKCINCEGIGFTVKIKCYNIDTGFSVKRKRLKICTECNGIGIMPITDVQKENIQKVRTL